MLIISECCRALGNLSHYPEVEAIFSNGADQILHQLLDSSDINLVVNVIGIFINFSLVKSDLKVFDQSEGGENSGIFKLLITMREFNDWRVSTLTLQLIWNLLRNAKKVVILKPWNSMAIFDSAMSNLATESRNYCGVILC